MSRRAEQGSYLQFFKTAGPLPDPALKTNRPRREGHFLGFLVGGQQKLQSFSWKDIFAWPKQHTRGDHYCETGSRHYVPSLRIICVCESLGLPLQRLLERICLCRHLSQHEDCARMSEYLRIWMPEVDSDACQVLRVIAERAKPLHSSNFIRTRQLCRILSDL